MPSDSGTPDGAESRSAGDDSGGLLSRKRVRGLKYAAGAAVTGGMLMTPGAAPATAVLYGAGTFAGVSVGADVVRTGREMLDGDQDDGQGRITKAAAAGLERAAEVAGGKNRDSEVGRLRQAAGAGLMKFAQVAGDLSKRQARGVKFLAMAAGGALAAAGGVAGAGEIASNLPAAATYAAGGIAALDAVNDVADTVSNALSRGGDESEADVETEQSQEQSQGQSQGQSQANAKDREASTRRLVGDEIRPTGETDVDEEQSRDQSGTDGPTQG